ncbi:MAG: electron transfer flavoprotein subunit alpha/FixB family protein [Alphaproteobacteria bacterium]|nr:electron transfer flavoprotein subunit alpha/FixB family protein [Alphaproteobacteria bacterium]
MGNNILVVAETDDGAVKKTAFELLGKAKALAASTGGAVHAVLIGDGDAASLGAYGASTVHHASGAAFSHYNPAAWTSAVQGAIAASDAGVVLAAAGPQVRDGFARLAARLGAGLATEVTELRAEGGAVVGRRPQFAGKAFSDVVIRSAVALFTVRPNSFGVPEAGGGSASVSALAAGGDSKEKVVGSEEPSSDVVDLTEAERIVSGGRAVKSAENFDKLIRPLAASIGATPGASRAAVDAGYAPHNEQVGQTGKVVNPSLYIACGISGAIQHLAGMRTSKVIVAINKDPEAPIFQHATYGIVGDIFDICPMLTAELESA